MEKHTLTGFLHKNKLIIIPVSALFLVIIIFLIFGNEENITGAMIADPSSEKSGESSESASMPGGGKSQASGTKESGKENLAGDAAGTEQFQDVHIVSDMQMQEYTIPIEKLDLYVNSDGISIITSEADFTITPKEDMVLKDFVGTIKWKDGHFTLEGQLYQYLTDYITINWKDDSKLSLGIEKGEVRIEKLEIDDFNVIASGKVTLDDKVVMNLDRDNIAIGDYKGSFEAAVSEGVNTIKLDGVLSSFNIQTENFGMGLD